MLSRKAVDALVKDAIENKDIYYGNSHTRGDKIEDTKMYDVFKVGVVDKDFLITGDYLSEDYYVCNRLRKLGFEIYVDINVKTQHNGMYVF